MPVGICTYYDEIGTTFVRRPQWTTLNKPVMVGVVDNPIPHGFSIFRRDPCLVGIGIL